MRKAASIALLFLLLANFGGPYVYFAYRAIQIKHDMRALLKTLPDEELEIIALTPEAFTLARVEEHEIKVDGKMYDIARIVSANGTLHVYCVHDKDEDNLLSFLDAVLNNLQCDNSPAPPALALFSMLQYLPEKFSFDFALHLPEIKWEQPFTTREYTYNQPVNTPPPRPA